MEFPIRFPAPFLNSGPLPYIRSGPSPYISTYPTPYLNYSSSPYIISGKAPYEPVSSSNSSYTSSGNTSYANTDPALYSSYTDTSKGRVPHASSNPSNSSYTSSTNASYASTDTSKGKTPYASSNPSNSSYTSSSNISYASTDPVPYSNYTDASRSKARFASRDSASSSNSSYSSSGNASSGNSSYSSDSAMETSQELEEEEYPDGKDLTMKDSGISCSDDSESGQNPGRNVRGSRKRKSFEPCRTLLQDDPNFRGVTVTMENKFVDSEWKFVMKSTFSLPPKKKRKFRPYVDSSDDEDMNNNFTPITEEKHCASCNVKKTPLWRDAEDGTPLCNACGIRYKKYKLRCGACWHIPKKDEFRPTCQYCGSFYEYIYPRR